MIRDAILNNPLEPTVAFTAFNIDMPRALIAKLPDLSSLLQESNFWLGPSRIVIAVNMPDHNDNLNICLVSEDSEGEEGEWHTHGDLGKVKSKFADFEPRIASLLDLARPENCYTWRFSDLPPLEKWSNENGKMVIVGDAAHAMLPYTNQVSPSPLQFYRRSSLPLPFQGASQCIEDSASLALCLSNASTPSDFPKILSAFESIRKPRVEWLIKRGHENAKMWHLPDGPEQQQRDRFLGAKIMGSAGKSTWDGKNLDEPPVGQWSPLVGQYIQGYDVADYVSTNFNSFCNSNKLAFTHMELFPFADEATAR